jgi:hypothetical protein
MKYIFSDLKREADAVCVSLSPFAPPDFFRVGHFNRCWRMSIQGVQRVSMLLQVYNMQRLVTWLFLSRLVARIYDIT